MKIIADKHIPFLEGIAEKYGETKYLAGSDFTHEAVKDADILIVRTVAKINKELLHDTAVKLVCTATIGIDHIDTKYCDQQGIKWVNAPGCNAGAVEQYVSAALIELSRKMNFKLSEKTIGIVGVGNVGKLVARVSKALGMKVLLNDPPREDAERTADFVSIQQIKEEADIITLHVPLTKEGEYKTYHMVDTDFFAHLTKKPILINSCRGAVIDTQALKDAIQKKKVSATVIDCWENEPTIDRELLDIVDIGTAHIAGYSSDGKANAARVALNTIADYLGKSSEPIKEIVEEIPSIPLLRAEDLGENILHEAILRTYTPLRDDILLRKSPEKFKVLRNEYDYRREFRAYSIEGVKSDDLKEKLSSILFSIK